MTLLFDLDGTLLDSNGIWQQIDVEFLTKRGIAWTEAYNEGVIHATFPAAAHFTKRFCQLAESEEEIMQEWRSMAFYAYSKEIPLKSGVAAFLRACATENFPMAIYTSCEEDLCNAALDHHQIRHYFQKILFARKMGVEKSAPEGFQTVARLLETKTNRCLFFDDSPVACQGAKTAGMHVIGCKDPLFAAYRCKMEAFCDGYLDSFDCLIPQHLNRSHFGE